METPLILILLILILDIASWCRGYDSTEKFNSPEWERRATWPVLEGSTPPGVRGGNPMGPNMYLYEKTWEVHSQDLCSEAEKERLLRRLVRHRQSIIRRAAGKLGVLLLKLGARLKQFEQSPGVRDNQL